MKKVYICSPYSSDGPHMRAKNLENAHRYNRIALFHGYLPIAPHAMYGYCLNDDYANDREIGLAAGLELLKECEEIWIFGMAQGGMVKKVEKAKELGITERFFTRDGDEKDGGGEVWQKA